LGFLAKGRPRLWLDHAIIGWIVEQSIPKFRPDIK
jgi:hypothetical protein